MGAILVFGPLVEVRSSLWHQDTERKNILYNMVRPLLILVQSNDVGMHPSTFFM